MVDPNRFSEWSLRLAAEIDRTLTGSDLAPLDQRSRDAIAATPRHLFFQRFTTAPGSAVHAMTDDPAVELLEMVYSDRGFGHVGPDDSELPSTNSVPSYMLRLLALLDLQPGQRVLEIGSGSGWLVALMGRLVAPDGRVVGLEILPSLVEQSHEALARADIEGVEIHLADGALGHASLAPFDRAIVTASSYDVPHALFEQIREGGLLVIPIADPSGQRSEVVLLERRGAGFVKRTASIGEFVPLSGASARHNPHVCALADVPGWSAAIEPRERHSLRFGATSRREFGYATHGFRRFLARRDPRFVVASGTADEPAPSWFGLADPSGASLALCSWDGACGYGEPETMSALLGEYATWCRLGMPGPDVFDLLVLPAGAPATGHEGHACIDARGDAMLHWSLRDDVPELPPR